MGLDMLLLEVLVQSQLRKGCHFNEQTFLVNKCFLAMSMFVLGLTCSTIQYCDELSNSAKVFCRWLFREKGHFYNIPSYSLKAYPPRREDVISHPVSG